MTIADRIKSAPFAEAKDLVKNQLLNNDEWLVRGLMAIFARQTADEQDAEQTHYHNKVGFNSADSELLSGFAKQWQERGWFSTKQMIRLRQKMPKYAGQLVRIARGSEVAVAV